MASPKCCARRGVEQADFLREGVRVLAEELMEIELAEHLGAERHECTAERTGYRQRPWDMRVGTIELQVPRVRDGSFFPTLLEPRRRAERALVAVVQEAYVQGISTRRVDDLCQIAPRSPDQQACHWCQRRRTRWRFSARHASRLVR